MRFLYSKKEIVAFCSSIQLITIVIAVLCSYKATANTYEYYVFVSSSMPRPSLMQLLEQSKKINAAVVLRGFINDSHKTTTFALQDLINITQYGLIVDPELFTKYEITKVPTFVITNENKYDKVSGNISWQEAINLIKKQGEVYADK